ncbi:drebrin-like protein isoform X1 [Rhizophagus clarus]|uniref:Drebrin-like protein isoform X1 n=1 Tax=Rhizophagus clarus TaxID=94130 RepID=A0A8H3KWV9_9GLOM|nr:drebrin-like protein isoform X1 [Rhizophagus clarus]
MSLSVNFNTHSKALSSTHQSVLNGDKETSWVIYGYDKGNNDLKVLEKGAGGLEELVEEFHDGKIQYAFVRVIDPNTELPKFVLIGWCGEGVPEIKKGLFNSHFNEVSKFLKGYHLQINARSEDDVDPKYIMKRINESGGSKYSININKEKSRKEDPILPVHSVYEPVKIPDIAALQRQAPREEFKPIGSVYQPVQLPKPKPLGTRSTWTTPAEEPSQSGSSPAELKTLREHERAEKERERIEREEREREKLERERIEREKKEREEKDRLEAERLEAERLEAERLEAERLEAERLEAERLEAERLEAERLEAERQEEAARKEQAEREEQDRIKHVRELQRQREIEEERSRKAKEDQERMEKTRREKEEREKREREEEEERQRLEFEREQEQEAARLQLEQEHQLTQTGVISAESTGSITAIVQFSYDASEDNEMSLIEGEVIRDIIQLDEGWWQGVSADRSRSGLFPANYVEITENIVPDSVEDSQEVEVEQPTVDSAHTAKALYDYTASEENEISFSDGDIITDIDFVSEEWWQGKAPDGTVGLFPANYVDLQN